MALTRDGHRLLIVDERGETFRPADLGRWRGLPVISGEGAREAVGSLAAILAEDQALRRRVTSAVRVGGRRWDVVIDDRIRVLLPAEGERAAWQRLIAAEKADRLLERAVTAIDLRVDGRMLLRVDEALIAKAGGGA
jgi:cell division protein FtsQ